jgi:hypothetical protein
LAAASISQKCNSKIDDSTLHESAVRKFPAQSLRLSSVQRF